MGGIKHAIDTLTKVSPTSSKISTAIKNIIPRRSQTACSGDIFEASILRGD